MRRSACSAVQISLISLDVPAFCPEIENDDDEFLPRQVQAEGTQSADSYQTPHFRKLILAWEIYDKQHWWNLNFDVFDGSCDIQTFLRCVKPAFR